MVKDILLYNYYQGRLTGPHMMRMKSSVRRLVYGACGIQSCKTDD